MKITKYITIACIVTSLSGCDYLDFDESIGKTQDEMYTYFENISSLATYIYSQLPQDYGAIGGAVRDAATDNAVYTWNSNSVYDIYNGNWSPLNPIDDVWGIPPSVPPILFWRTIHWRSWNVSNGIPTTRKIWKRPRCM